MKRWIVIISALALFGPSCLLGEDLPTAYEDEYVVWHNPEAPSPRLRHSLNFQVVDFSKNVGLVRKPGHLRSLARRIGSFANPSCPDELLGDPAVLYCTRNWVHHASKTLPSDPMVKSPFHSEGWQHHLEDFGYLGKNVHVDIGAPEAWEITTGSRDVVVAVMDSGIDLDHPDLKENLWVNVDEIAGNGIDDDGNGYVDDVHGINAVNPTKSPTDVLGHGTHVAGIIGAVGDNEIGGSGVAWQIQLIVIKNLTDQGRGNLFDSITGWNYLLDLKLNRGVPISAINASFGGSVLNDVEAAALSLLRDAGILVVNAAGNNDADLDSNPESLSSYRLENQITVCAAESDQSSPYLKKASFSNFGVETCDIAAPGVSIISTVPGGWDIKSGTSMATPMVTGAIALLKAARPELSVFQIKDLILGSARTDAAEALGRFVNQGRFLSIINSLKAPTPKDSFSPTMDTDSIPTEILSGGVFSISAQAGTKALNKLIRRRKAQLTIEKQDLYDAPSARQAKVRVTIDDFVCPDIAVAPLDDGNQLRINGSFGFYRGNHHATFEVLNYDNQVTGQTELRIHGSSRASTRIRRMCRKMISGLMR